MYVHALGFEQTFVISLSARHCLLPPFLISLVSLACNPFLKAGRSVRVPLAVPHMHAPRSNTPALQRLVCPWPVLRASPNTIRATFGDVCAVERTKLEAARAQALEEIGDID